MKTKLLVAMLLLVAAAGNGCQDMAEGQAKEKLAEDMTTRPAARRWFWWGGDPEQAPPGANPAPAAPVATAPPAGQG
jgi:hypothetical protein